MQKNLDVNNAAGVLANLKDMMSKYGKNGELVFNSQELSRRFGNSTGVSWTLQTLYGLGLIELRRAGKGLEGKISSDNWKQITELMRRSRFSSSYGFA